MLGMNLGDPGDAILVSRPIYGRFELDFGNEARLKICYVEMNGVDSFEEKFVEKYEDALLEAREVGNKIRAILIVNPSNPLGSIFFVSACFLVFLLECLTDCGIGKCYPESTLRGLLMLCQRYRVHLISDEIYALSVFDSGELSAVPFYVYFVYRYFEIHRR